MHVKVKTLEGAWEIPGLAASTTVAQLLELLQEHVEGTSLAGAPLKLVRPQLLCKHSSGESSTRLCFTAGDFITGS